jgi:hypothetical protein
LCKSHLASGKGTSEPSAVVATVGIGTTIAAIASAMHPAGLCETLAHSRRPLTIPIVTVVPAVQFNKVYPPQRRRDGLQPGFGGG